MSATPPPDLVALVREWQSARRQLANDPWNREKQGREARAELALLAWDGPTPEVSTVVEYGHRFCCANTQEGHEDHRANADYFDVIGRPSERWTPDELRQVERINGHDVELVQRTITYGPWGHEEEGDTHG